ncbi:MAG: ParB/RepB/Spo0J family partition protein [Nanoarchaeota archaeon]
MRIEEIPIEKIEVDDNQPRKDMVYIGELANSILKEGLINPIDVLKINGKYKIIDGERRFRAILLLKRKTINCIVRTKVKDTFVRQLIVDFHKEKLNIVEQAEAIQKLEDGGYSLQEIRQLLGLGKSKFQTLKKILRFNGNTKKLIKEGSLTQSIINNISMDLLNKNKEDEIIKAILEKKAKSRYQVEKIILEKSDIRFMVNEYLSDAYVFELKTTNFNKEIRENKEFIDRTIEKTITSNSNQLESELLLLKSRLVSIMEKLNERKNILNNEKQKVTTSK